MKLYQFCTHSSLYPAALLAFAFAICGSHGCGAQLLAANGPAPSMISSSSAPLPDAPSPTPRTATEPLRDSSNRPAAGELDKYIDEGQQAPRLAIGDKVLLGMRSSVSERAMAGWVGIAVFEQALDHSPKYGQNFKGFAQRLGAAAARDTSEDMFSDAVLAPILRQDPRYYQLGPGHGFIRRTLYAATRTLITRDDNGDARVNYSLLGGNLAGAALTLTYYPPNSTGFAAVMKIFAGSVGGSAFGFVVDEFLHDQLVEMRAKL